jgi:hypothetical protein
MDDSTIAAAFRLQIVGQEQVDAVREELSNKAGGDAEAAYAAERGRAGETKRAELEAQVAAAEAAAAAAAEEAHVRSHRASLSRA